MLKALRGKETYFFIHVDACLLYTSGVLGGEYNFNLTEVGLYKRFWFSSWGKIDMFVKGEMCIRDSWQTIYKVVIPFSISGITSGVVLGIGRAIGETMAVLMVTGNAAVIPTTILEPLRTIPATIAAELGEAPAGGAHYEALFLLGVVLFFITMLINFSVEYISSRTNK